MSEQTNGTPSALLNAADCMLVVLAEYDGVADSYCFPPGAARLLAACREFNIPAYVYPPELSLTRTKPNSPNVDADPDLPKTTAKTAIDDNAFWQWVKTEDRPKPILVGTDLEGAVVQTALSLLAEGYDVHILLEQSGGLLEDTVSIVAARLMQAGAVPVTLAEVLSEWCRGAGERNSGSSAPARL